MPDNKAFCPLPGPISVMAALDAAIHAASELFVDLFQFHNLISLLFAWSSVLVDGRDKPGHDGKRTPAIDEEAKQQLTR